MSRSLPKTSAENYVKGKSAPLTKGSGLSFTYDIIAASLNDSDEFTSPTMVKSLLMNIKRVT